MKELDDWDRDAKILLYCLGRLADLKAMGLVDGPDAISARGIAAYDQLVAEGFTPTDDELSSCMRFLMTKGI